MTKPKSKDKRLYWTPTIQVRAGLARLEELGLYGENTTHIVNHVITEEVKRLLANGLLTREALDSARKTAQAEWGPQKDDDGT